MYLDDAVKDKPYRVVDYRDHFPARQVRYFDDFDSAFGYYKTRIGVDDIGSYVGAVVLFNNTDGRVIHKESWRILL